MEATKGKNSGIIESMFKVGAHFGYTKSRRHPTAAPFIFGVKNKVEIIDLEKTHTTLVTALDFVKKIAAENGQILFVSSKNEAREAIRSAAASIGMPFTAGRWIGGSFTNFMNIRKRVERLETLVGERERGELAKYTKKERLLIDREIAKLDRFFSGLIPMKQMPKALFVVDSNKEHIAVTEATSVGMPIIALSSSDCNLSTVDYPIVANDSSNASITFFLNEIVKAYKAAHVAPVAKKAQ